MCPLRNWWQRPRIILDQPCCCLFTFKCLVSRTCPRLGGTFSGSLRLAQLNVVYAGGQMTFPKEMREATAHKHQIRHTILPPCRLTSASIKCGARSLYSLKTIILLWRLKIVTSLYWSQSFQSIKFFFRRIVLYSLIVNKWYISFLIRFLKYV